MMSTTFSQLVDKMSLELKRPDLATEIGTYLNQTIRELHFEPTRGNVVHFAENLREDQLTANVSVGFSWMIPNPSVFQALTAVQYATSWDQGQQIWPKMIQPGRVAAGLVNFYYRSGQNFYFAGYGGLNALINLAWHEYPRGLKYYPPDTRPASYDEDDGWTYLPVYDVDESTRKQAQLLTQNWLLDRWDMIIEEGLRAKVYKRISDDARSKTSYSLYSQLRQGLYTSEAEKFW